MKQLSLILMLIILSCNEKKVDSAPSTDKITPWRDYCMYINAWHEEYLALDSLYLNGKIPLLTNKKMLREVLGKPDKTVEIPIELAYRSYLKVPEEEKAYYYYYGRNIFLCIGDVAIYSVIDFENSDVTLLSSKINLSGNTQPIDVQKVFPESGKLGIWAGSMVFGYLMLNNSRKGGPYKSSVIFRGGKLKKMVLHNVAVFN
jgi:hypothetical protein